MLRGNLKYFIIYLGTYVPIKTYTTSHGLLSKRMTLCSVNPTISHPELLPNEINWNWDLQTISDLILHEDDSLMILYKPPSILSQSNSKNDESLYDACKKYLLQKDISNHLDLIHRIDQPCSGIILFSKTPRGTAFLNSQFQDRTVKKMYHCVVNGQVEGRGECNHLLQKSSTSKIYAFDMNTTRKDLVEASLSYEVIFITFFFMEFITIVYRCFIMLFCRPFSYFLNL